MPDRLPARFGGSDQLANSRLYWHWICLNDGRICFCASSNNILTIQIPLWKTNIKTLHTDNNHLCFRWRVLALIFWYVVELKVMSPLCGVFGQNRNTSLEGKWIFSLQRMCFNLNHKYGPRSGVEKESQGHSSSQKVFPSSSPCSMLTASFMLTSPGAHLCN